LDYREVLEKSVENKRYLESKYYEEFRKLILHHIQGRTLEIGCGDGAWTGLIKEESSKLISIDLAYGRIKRAKDKVKDGKVVFMVCDARQLPFRSNSFDTICAFEVIEHLPAYEDHTKFLSEVKRVLSRDGTFLVSTPNKLLFRIYCKILGEKHSTHFSEVNYLQFKFILNTHFTNTKIYGQFGWLSPFYKYKFIRKFHNLLSKFPPICKGLLAVCRK